MGGTSNGASQIRYIKVAVDRDQNNRILRMGSLSFYCHKY